MLLPSCPAFARIKDSTVRAEAKVHVLTQLHVNLTCVCIFVIVLCPPHHPINVRRKFDSNREDVKPASHTKRRGIKRRTRRVKVGHYTIGGYPRHNTGRRPASPVTDCITLIIIVLRQPTTVMKSTCITCSKVSSTS
jgi:hypothetical protein